MADSVRNASVIDDFVLDPWTALSFKRALGDRRMAGVSWTTSAWVGQSNQRRLLAYKMRHAYYENAARHFLPTPDSKAKEKHREYGDAALIVETVMQAVKGEDPRLTVSGSDEWDPDTGEQTAGNAETPPDEQAENRRAANLLDDLERWCYDEQFPLKFHEVERTTGKLGDGVYALGWSGKKTRPRLRTYDPGFYFPILSTRGDEDYPKRVHIAWEIADDDDDPTFDTTSKVRIHRITWELRDVDEYELPWDPKAKVACYMSEGIFTIEKTGTATIDHLHEAEVEWLTTEDGDEFREVNIGIDFIPVVHVPNAVALEAHFGPSVVDKVLQLLDDIAKADTDLQTAAELAGFPPIGVSNATLPGGASEDGTDDSRSAEKVLTYGPGTAFELGDGRMETIDLSAGVTALIGYVNHLLERLEVNARVPAGILGRVKPSEVPSGIALALSFGPLRSLVEEMRLVRGVKYRLLFRFVTRFLWLNEALTDDQPPEVEAEWQFGTFLPPDQSGIVTQVTALVEKRIISKSTGLAMLAEAGVPIDDVAEELAAANAEDFEGAGQLLDATDDVGIVLEYLGREPVQPPAPPPTPTPTLPEPAPAPVPPPPVPAT